MWNRCFLHVCDRSGFLQGTRTGENLCWSYRRNKGLVAALRQMRRTSQGKQFPPLHPKSWVFTAMWLSASFFLDAWCDQTVSRFSVFLQNNQTGAGIAYSLIDGPGFEFRQGKLVFPSPKRPDSVWDPPSLLDSGYGCSVLEIKRPGSDVDTSPPSSAEVKNEWIYTSSPPVCLYCLDRDKFALC